MAQLKPQGPCTLATNKVLSAVIINKLMLAFPVYFRYLTREGIRMMQQVLDIC